uniref:TF-B3 domain-containing protein n=1 Tax=Setaria italica TaxID=4555 RepID=K3Y2K3_SETIT
MAPLVRRARPKYAAALLSPTCLHKLRVPGEFAAWLGGEARAAAAVLLVSPLGKVWHADLRRAGGGGGPGPLQLAGGWAEFAAAHGVRAGWSVVFRLERRGWPPSGRVAAGKNRPRFIRVLNADDLEKMRIPDEFVQEHLTDTHPSSKRAMIFSPLGKFWRVELDRDQPGVLLGDGWVRFLTAHDLSEGNILVFRYDDSMVFTVEVFMQSGCLKEYEAATADMTDDAIGRQITVPQQGDKELCVSPVKKKRKTRNENTCLAVYRKKPNHSPISVKKAVSQKKLVSIEPRHSFTKRITGYNLTSLFAVKGSFCSSVGLAGACEITLKTKMGNTRSWRVRFNTTNTYGYITGQGWK